MSNPPDTAATTTYDPLDPDQACRVCLTPYTTDEPESEHQCGWEWIQP